MRIYRDSFQALLLPLNVNCFLFCHSLYSATFVHSQNESFFVPCHSGPRLNQLDSGVLLFYSALFCCHSTSFRYIPVAFLFIPSHSDVIRSYSRVIPPCSGIFRYMPLYLCVIPPHSGVIPARFGIFRYHSYSFRLIQVSFRIIPAYSGLFRYIPFCSVSFLCLVTPVFRRKKIGM